MIRLNVERSIFTLNLVLTTVKTQTPNVSLSSDSEQVPLTSRRDNRQAWASRGHGRSTSRSLSRFATRSRQENGCPVPCCPASRDWPPGTASPAPPSTGRCPSCGPKDWSGRNEEEVPP